MLFGDILRSVAVEKSRKREQEALKFTCLKLKRAVSAAFVTWDAQNMTKCWSHG